MRTFSRVWLSIGLTCLALSGVLALFLAISRMPWIAHWFSDPHFFRRTLVIHVDLGVTVWFTAFPLALCYFCTDWFMSKTVARLSPALPTAATVLSVGGIILFAISGFFGTSTPLLSNYIPMVASSEFTFGILLYFLGVYLQIAYLLFVVWPRMPAFPLKRGLQTGAVFFLLSFVALIADGLRTDSQLLPASFYEVALWGGGHLMQHGSAVFMLVCWYLLVDQNLWRDEDSPRQDGVTNSIDSPHSGPSQGAANALFIWLSLPILGALLFIALGPEHPISRFGYTQLMKYGIFPPILAALIWTFPEFLSFRRSSELGTTSIARLMNLALRVSAFVILSGFIYGFTIRGQDLRIPGHYHASIGAVSLAYTAIALGMAGKLGWINLQTAVRSPLSRAFVWCYGLGQWMHATGLLTAGFLGLSRKVYGTEQKVTHPAAPIAMGFMGLGSLVAVVGAVLFFVVLIRHRHRSSDARSKLKTPSDSMHSNAAESAR